MAMSSLVFQYFRLGAEGACNLESPIREDKNKQANQQIKEKPVVSSQRTGKGEKPSPVRGKPFDDTFPTPANDISRD